jgi:hypothetical protein
MLICLVIYLQDLKTHIKCFKICYIFVKPTLLVKNYLCVYLIFYKILKLSIKLFMTSSVQPPVRPRSDQ